MTILAAAAVALFRAAGFVEKGIQAKQDQLAAAALKAEQPKSAIHTTVDIPSQINKIGQFFGNTELTLRDKVVNVFYINGKGGRHVDNATLKTTHWFIAAIMNIFSCIFPCCVQGAAKFSIGNQECYVRRALIQKTFPDAKIQRHAFQGTEVQNSTALKEAARQHFVKA